MKRVLFLLIIMLVALISISAEEKASPTIAIMDVAATNTSDVKSQVIYEYIVDVVNKAELYTIVERSALQAAIDEMQIGSSGLVDDTTAAQIGKLAGAEFILISNLIVDDGITYLSTRIVSVETGQVTNTAMLQAGDGEYIASLASRTVSELLGVAEVKKNELVKEETASSISQNSSNKTSGEPAKVNNEVGGSVESEGTAAGSVKKSRSSISISPFGIVPLLDSGTIFKIGYGVNIDFDYSLSPGNGGLSIGAGAGFLYDKSKDTVLFPFDYAGIPFYINLKYNLILGRFFLAAKIGGGGTYNIFTYTAGTPFGISKPLQSLNPAIFPGVSIGYMMGNNFGLAIFGDWSMTFFTSRPYTAVNAGLAAVINL